MQLLMVSPRSGRRIYQRIYKCFYLIRWKRPAEKNYTVFSASTTKTAATLDAEKVNINTTIIGVCAKFVKKEGVTFQVGPPEKVVQEKKIMVVYCTQVVPTKKIEFVTEDIEACLGPTMGEATNMNLEHKYGTVDVRFTTQEKAVLLHSTTVLKNERIALLPSCRRRRNVRIKIGRVSP